MTSAPEPGLCACGCGERVRRARYPSQQARYIAGHQHRGHHNGNYRGGKVPGACAICGAEFTHFPSRRKVTCSPTCYAKWVSLTTAARGKQWVPTTCDQCGGPIWRPPSQIEERNFCGRACQYAWRSANTGGPNGHNWRGGAIKYFQVQTRVRDSYACVICGFALVTEVHHITPVAAGGKHEFTNLVTLCPNHHRLAHLGFISLESYRRADWQPEHGATPVPRGRRAPANR